VTRTSSAFAIAALGAVTMFTTRPARASDEITNLEKSLAEETATLSTSDCSAACRALASIRRAADKICALEPGERCTAAQAKAEDATRRVRDACPECAIASIAPDRPKAPAAISPSPAPPRDHEAMTKGGTNAPHSEPGRGGCASCDAGGAGPGDLGAGALGIVALLRLLRRRKQRP
jgi:MYXO-CTERM domain-containing protein